MVKLLHTADWQIGLRASHVAQVGQTVRRARMDAARALVEKANHERVDALLLAGDIFEDNHVDNALVHEVVGILSGAQVPVFVLPGNHDPLSQDSVYHRASWKARPPNIRLLDGFTPIEIAGGQALLVPAPLALKKSVEDPTDSMLLPQNGANTLLIGVAHGSLKIEGKYGRDDFPIALDAATRKGLSYLALGHWHGRYVHGDRTAYSGTMETTKFGENNSGMALLVELDSARAAPRVQEVQCGQLAWIAYDLDLNQGSESEMARVRKDLAALSERGNAKDRVLLRIRTSGECQTDDHFRLQAFEEELAAKVLYLEMDRRDFSSAQVHGRVADLMQTHPMIARLMERLQTQAVTDPDTGSARKLLGELLMAEDGGASL